MRIIEGTLGTIAGETVRFAAAGVERAALPAGRRPDLDAFFTVERDAFVVFLAVRPVDFAERPAVLVDCLLMSSI